MEDLAQLKPACAHKFGESLKIPTLSVNGAARPIGAATIDKTSEDYRAGHAAGAAESAERLEAESSRIAAIGAGLKNALRDIDERARNECATLIGQLFAALAPSIARQSVRAEINEIIHKNVVQKKKPITIRIHPELVNDLSIGNAEDVSDTAKISIETDEQLNPNAADIHWADGGMFYDPDALIADISSILADKDNTDKE